METQHIIFNLDDTLIECNKYFNQVNDQFVKLMTHWFPGIAAEEIRGKQMEYDVAAVDKNGLAIDHLPQSFTNAYLYYSRETGKAPSPEEEEELTALGYSVFRIPVEPLPYMHETLERLKEEGHELYLHTGGEEQNQRRKIAQLELAAYFDNRVFISTRKDVRALQKIIAEMNFDKRITWMVGNSLRTDVLPGLRQGINVIHIPAKTEWHYNVVDIDAEPQGAYLTLSSLHEVPEAIASYADE